LKGWNCKFWSIYLLLDPDPHSQYESGSRRAKIIADPDDDDALVFYRKSMPGHVPPPVPVPNPDGKDLTDMIKPADTVWFGFYLGHLEPDLHPQQSRPLPLSPFRLPPLRIRGLHRGQGQFDTVASDFVF
jgi:hypothetical protein